MNVEYIAQLKTLRNELTHVLEDLETSIKNAHTSFIKLYGPTHPTIMRLESYYPAIEKQKDYINQLTLLIDANNMDNYNIITAICAISEYIKADAKSLLHHIQTNQELLPEDLVYH